MRNILKRIPILKHSNNGRNQVNCMIVVQATKKRIFRYVPSRLIPRDSFEREYEGQLLHILGLDLEGKFWPITVPDEIKENESPVDLFMAKHCAEEVEEVYGLSVPMMERIKLGLLIFLCIAILIVIFMIAATSTGGKVV